MRNFKCQKSGDIFERIVIDEVTIVKCACGSEADRTLSAPRVLGNTTGRSPSFSNRS